MRNVVNVLTNAGMNLIAQAIGTENIVFVNAKLGTGSFDEWVSGTTYAVGDYVVYNSELYKCKTANSDVAWTASKWDAVGFKSLSALKTPYANGTAGISKKRVTDGTMIMTAQYVNTLVTEPVYINEIGVYAKLSSQTDAQAIMFSYLTFGDYPDLILSKDTATVQRVYDIPYVFAGAAMVTVTITPSTLIANEDAVTEGGAGAANKLLWLNEDGKFDVDITGDAITLGGHGVAYFATADHRHDNATNEADGFMSKEDKVAHDQLVQRVDQDLTQDSTTVRFSRLHVDYIDGARFV